MLNRLLFLTFAFIFSNFCFAQDGKVIEQVVAVVGNKVILLSDIENQYYQAKMQGVDSKGDIKCEIFEQLLFQKLLLNQAELDSIEITPKEVESTIENRFRYFISQIGSQEKLEEYYGKTLLEMKQDMKELIKEQMLSERMQSKITQDLKVSPSEVREFFKTIPEDSLPYLNTEIELQQIAIYPKISAEEKQIIKDKLNGYRERILKGDKFSTLAVLYSEDPASSKNGGELGFLGRGDLVPEFAAVAFNLKEGEISKIVETEFGFHIIQMIEKKGELANVRHILITPKATPQEGAKVKNKLDSIVNLIKIDTLNFEKAVAKYSEDEDSKNNAGLMVNNQNGTSKFETNQIDPTTYYIIKDLKVGDISAPFETKDDKGKTIYKVVKVKSKTKPHKANLKDDYQRIQDISLEQKKQKTINNWIKKKQETTYIHIDDSYKNCPFEIKGWVK